MCACSAPGKADGFGYFMSEPVRLKRQKALFGGQVSRFGHVGAMLAQHLRSQGPLRRLTRGNSHRRCGSALRRATGAGAEPRSIETLHLLSARSLW